MQVSYATVPAPGRQNEDFIVAGPEAVVVLDGAGLPEGMDTGCRHGVPWFVQHLGLTFHELASKAHADLSECLAETIHHVSGLHRGECDLGNPLTPSAAVAAARVRGEKLEWLALADSTVVIDGDGLQTFADHRVSEVTARQRARLAETVSALPAQQRQHAHAHAQRAVMNTADGYWAAATDPRAAHQALTGSALINQVRAAAIVTDGAARPVDDFREMTWEAALATLHAGGPKALIGHARSLETSDPDCIRWPRSKRHDDATAALLTF